MGTFAERIKDARRILVANPGGIGDDIHLLPALEVLRRHAKHAVFDIAASAGAETLLSPVDRVEHVFTLKWSPRFKDRRAKRQARWLAFKAAFTLRYDAWIDFRPSDPTQLLGLAARAPARLGVRCMYWDMSRPGLYTDVVIKDWINEPSYRFLLNCLDKAGFDTEGTSLGPHLLPASLVGNDAYCGCIHVSLCTSSDARELPVATGRALVQGLCTRFPQRRVVITCMNSPREIAMVDKCLQGLSYPNLEVAYGKFTGLELLALIRAAALHIGPDTGTVHMAWLCGTPSVSWYLNHESLMAWMPEGPRHTVLVSACEQSRLASSLSGIGADTLLEHAERSLTTQAHLRSLTGMADIRFILPTSAPSAVSQPREVTPPLTGSTG